MVSGYAPKYVGKPKQGSFHSSVFYLKHFIWDARQVCMDFRRISVISVTFYSFAT